MDWVYNCWPSSVLGEKIIYTILFLFISAFSFSQPANDNQASATDLTSLINGCSANAAYTTLNASADLAKGSCATNGPNYNVWFSFTATASTYMRIKLKTGAPEGTLQFSFLTLWDATLSELSCAIYSSQYSDIEVSYIGLIPGATYYISADNYTGTGYRGSFKLCLSDVVDYDWYQGATDVTSIINSCSADAAYTTLNASADQAKGSCATNGPNYNRWFKFTATTTTYMNIGLKTGAPEGTLQYPFLTLWDATLTQLSCAIYSSQYSDIEVSYTGLTPGATYYVSVDNYTGAGYRGSFKLCLSDVVDYDWYQGATDVTGIINSCSADAAYTTLNASADQAKGSCATNGPNYNRWFEFTASATTYMRIELKIGASEGTLQYPFLTLWDATLTQVSCAIYSSQYSDIEIDYMGLTPGATYYISVDNYTGAGYRGTFKLCLSDVVDYNWYQGADELTDLNSWCSSNAAYTTIGATSDQAKGSCAANGPNYNRWFKFTAISATATIQLKTGTAEGTLQYPFLTLWDATLTQVACAAYSSQYSDLTINYSSLTVGNTYYISIDNYTGLGYRGTFTLCIDNIGSVFYAMTSGNWNSTTLWSNTGYAGPVVPAYPGVGDIANIQGTQITVNSNENCAEFNMDVNVGATNLTIDNATLSVSGKLTMTNNGQNQNGNVILQNNGGLNIGNNAVFTRSGGANTFQLSITNSTMTVGQDMHWISTSGTVNTNNLTLNNASILTVNRDLLLNYSGGMKIKHTINNSGVLTVGRDISYNSTVAGFEEIKLNNTATLNIAGNFIRGGTPYGILTCLGSSTVGFIGSSNTQIFPAMAGSGGDGLTFNNVTINNTNIGYPQLTMGGAASINGTLTLSNGILQTTTSNILTLNAGASTLIGSSSSFIDGPFCFIVASNGITSINFPVGKGTDWRPAVLNVTHSDVTPVTYLAELYYSSAQILGYTLPGTIDRVSNVRYWKIDRQSVPNLTSATVTLYYDADDGVTDFANLIVVKTNGAGTTWFDIGGTATANTTGNIISGSFTTFSNFALGNVNGGSNPLPVELLSFTGRKNNKNAVLKWSTATETNNDYFEIEHSRDGEFFHVIGKLEGQGNTVVQHDYALTHYSPPEGFNYYRLKQVDFDGKHHYSKVIVVGINLDDISFTSIVFPNPVVSNHFTLRTKLRTEKEPFQVIIFDATGKMLINRTYQPFTTQVDIEYDLQLQEGMHFIHVYQGDFMHTVKLKVNK